jgi:hypothetical protein
MNVQLLSKFGIRLLHLVSLDVNSPVEFK